MSTTIEPPRKRPRLSRSANIDDIDPDFDLQASRARNDLRLKTTFEAIFRKYGQDFSNIGDEVDLETGEIVVNNGHITGMRNEHDVGDGHIGRNEDLEAEEDLRTFTAAFGEQKDPAEVLRKASNGLRSSGNDGDEDYNALADHGMQSDDDLDSLLGSSEQDTCVHSGRDLQTEDMWNTGEGADDETHWDDRVQLRELPSEHAILCQFGPSLGPQIARLVSNVRTANDLPVEGAWRVPDLAAAPRGRRPILTSLLNLNQERSLSPPSHTSIWASARQRGRPRRDESNIFGRKASTSGGSLTNPLAMLQVSVLRDGQSDCDRDIQDAAASEDIICAVESKRRRRVSPSRRLPSPEEFGSAQHATEQPATVAQGHGKSGPAARDASYSTPKSSPVIGTASLRGNACSSSKRKTVRHPKQKIEDVENEEQHVRNQENEKHLSWKQIAELYPGADSHTLVSRYHSQPPLASRMQKKPVSKCVEWAQEEEELLRHLKEHTSLTYAQLVEYFPGRHMQNIKWHYLKNMRNVKLRAQKAKAAPGPPFTPQEDELLMELRGKESVPWKDLLPRFPGRTVNTLTYRYYNVLPSTPLSRKPKTTAELTCAESQVSLTAIKKDDEPCEDLPAELDRPTTAAIARIARNNKPKQIEAIVHKGIITPVIATPSSGRRLHAPSVVPIKRRISSPECQVSQRSPKSAGGKSGYRKTSQLRSPQVTPRSSLKERQTAKSRKAQSASITAGRLGSTPGPKAAFVSFISEATDDEDELSGSVITLGTSKDLAFTTPNGTVRQCGVGGRRCGRQFCFKCM